MFNTSTLTAFNFKKLCMICLLAWLLGGGISITLYHFSPKAITKGQTKGTVPFSNNFTFKNSNIVSKAFSIFFHNGIVAIIICLGGFFTAGLLSIIMLIYNGFMATSIIINVIQPHNDLLYFIKNLVLHGIFEMTALILFGGIGLSGFFAFKAFFQSKPILVSQFLSSKKIIIPIFLLALAAIIESL